MGAGAITLDSPSSTPSYPTDRTSPSATPRAQNPDPPAGAKSPSTPDQPQHAKSSKESPLRFHTTPHSFVDYGSSKGAVRIPMAGFNKPKALGGPPRALNTLDGRGSGPNSAQPPAKRKKVDNALYIHGSSRQPEAPENIVDLESDSTPIRDLPSGEPTRLAGSVSTDDSGSPSVDKTVRGHDDSKRRRRDPPSPEEKSSARKKQRITSVLENDDGPDVLAMPMPPKPRPNKQAQREPSDAADKFIFPNNHRGTLKSSHRKRTNPDPIEDDVMQESVQNQNSATASHDRPAIATKMGSSSISRKGDLNPTNFERLERLAVAKPSECVSVKAAVCLQKHRYSSDQPGFLSCYLGPTKDHELYAVTRGGYVIDELYWLKIGHSTQKLVYNEDSSFVVVKQSTDERPGKKIGPTMVIEFENTRDAKRVIGWARNLVCDILTSEGSKLSTTFAKTEYKVLHALESERLALEADSHPKPRRFAESKTRVADPPCELEVHPQPQQPVVPNSQVVDTRRGVRLREQMQDKSPPQHVDSSEAQIVQSTRPPISRGEKPLTQPTERRGQQLATSTGLRATRRRSNYVEIDDDFERPFVAPVSATPPKRWTEENIGWRARIKEPLSYYRTTVDQDDILRLDEGQYLNDNLIGFGLTYLFESFKWRHPDLKKHVYLYNSFFYEKLKAPRGGINYDAVKGWTAKVDLFSYDYIVVPVNESFHWWVAIICNPGRLDPEVRKAVTDAMDSSSAQDDKGAATGQKQQSVEGRSDILITGAEQDGSRQEVATTGLGERSINTPDQDLGTDATTLPTAGRPSVDLTIADNDGDVEVVRSTPKPGKPGKKSAGPPLRKYNPDDPRIITLDSLGASHSPAVSNLKRYLAREFENKRGRTLTDIPQQLGMKATNIPQQDNYHDCGVYLLGYVQEFVKDPDLFTRTLLQRETPEWRLDSSELRQLWRDTIFKEVVKCQNKQCQEKGVKRALSRASGSSSPSKFDARPAHSRETAGNSRAVPEGVQLQRTLPQESQESVPPSPGHTTAKAPYQVGPHIQHSPATGLPKTNNTNDPETDFSGLSGRGGIPAPNYSISSPPRNPPPQLTQPNNEEDEVHFLEPEKSILQSVEVGSRQPSPVSEAREPQEPAFIERLPSSPSPSPSGTLPGQSPAPTSSRPTFRPHNPDIPPGAKYSTSVFRISPEDQHPKHGPTSRSHEAEGKTKSLSNPATPAQSTVRTVEKASLVRKEIDLTKDEE